jgi:multidrug efflux pump
MNFPHFFIDRPIFAGVISIVITLVGVIALSTLPIAQYPEIAPPTIQVTTNYPGANAKVVSETVATPIEQQVNGVENMLYMSSQSTSDGNMTLSITFKLGTNLDTAQVLVQNRVAIAIPVLPPEVQRIGVTTKKQSPDITMVVHLVSPDGSLDSLFTSNYALLQIRDELARVDGVGDINVFGAREYSMRLWESSASRRCRREQRHFNTRLARKADSRTKRSSAKSSLRPAPTAKSRTCAISRGLSSPRAITR